MSKINFSKYKNAIVTIEIKSKRPEKFINLLWENGVNVKDLKKVDITTMIMDVSLKDYFTVCDVCKRTKTKIKIIDRKGVSFFIIKTRKRKTLIGGIFIFGVVIYLLSTFIWFIDINTEKSMTPFELRTQLKGMGVKPGINKKDIDVYKIEEELLKKNDDIMWVRTRIEGSKLVIKIAERQQPPKIEEDENPCNLIAKKDGEVVRLYSSAGTAAVECGDIVKKGDILIKGEQGKEESVYPVHAEGSVIAKTFHERIQEAPLKKNEKVRTGEKDKSIYIKAFGKNICLKKAKNNFKIYDKIVSNKGFVVEENYYEVIEKTKKLDEKLVAKETVEALSNDIIVKLDKSVKIVDKIVESEPVGDKIKVRLVLIVEENIAEVSEIQEPQEEKQEEQEK